MDPSFVSIGMPVYNSERFVRRALDSVLAQDYENFELIISDDGSSDATPQICRDYAGRDKRVTLYENACNIGPLANFRRVLDAARGEYFMWAAHDDYRDTNYVRVLIERLQAADQFGLCCARYVKVMPDGQVISEHSFPNPKSTGVLPATRRIMAGSGAPWAYGLYRTAWLRPIFCQVQKVNLIWFWDHLLILNFLLNQALTGTNETTIYQVKTGLSALIYKPQSFAGYVRFAARLVPEIFKILLRSKLTPAQKLGLSPNLILYMEMQVFHLRHWGPARATLQYARHRYRWMKQRVVA